MRWKRYGRKPKKKLYRGFRKETWQDVTHKDSEKNPWNKPRPKQTPGVKPVPYTELSRWMIKNKFTNPGLAKILGCSRISVARWRAGEAIAAFYSRILRSMYPDCPVPRGGPAEVSARPLPIGDLPIA